jgi:hypothetical protein
MLEQAVRILAANMVCITLRGFLGSDDVESMISGVTTRRASEMTSAGEIGR